MTTSVFLKISPLEKYGQKGILRTYQRFRKQAIANIFILPIHPALAPNGQQYSPNYKIPIAMHVIFLRIVYRQIVKEIGLAKRPEQEIVLI